MRAGLLVAGVVILTYDLGMTTSSASPHWLLWSLCALLLGGSLAIITIAYGR